MRGGAYISIRMLRAWASIRHARNGRLLAIIAAASVLFTGGATGAKLYNDCTPQARPSAD
jgi:hypothetical protein